MTIPAGTKFIGISPDISTVEKRSELVNNGSEGYTIEEVAAATGGQPLTEKDESDGYVGLTLLKINFKNALDTITSFFTNSNTAARTYTFQNRDGTIADDTDLALKLNIEAAATTGTALTFLTDRVYGTIGSPETGNISYSATNAKVGVTNIIIHNHSVEPTFAANMKKLSGSGNYTTSVVNYIYVTYINATEVIYAISQRT